MQLQVVLQCLLHVPQLLPKRWTFAVLFAVAKANSTWGMYCKRCNTQLSHEQLPVGSSSSSS